MKIKPWYTRAELDDVARAMYLRHAYGREHPDDIETPEEQWANGFTFKHLWVQGAMPILDAMAEHVARREGTAEIRGGVKALRNYADYLNVITKQLNLNEMDTMTAWEVAEEVNLRSDRLENGEL